MGSSKECDARGITLEEERHHLEIKSESRLKILFQGPFLQHSRLVYCADVLKGDNSWSPTTDRFWPISPQRGGQDKLTDAVAIFLWIIFIVFPTVAIPIGSCFRNICNVVNAVTLSLVVIYFLICFYIIIKNNKKFRRQWFIIKSDDQTCNCNENQVTFVTREVLNNLSFLSLREKRELDLKLAQNPNKVAVLMVCSRSFWKCRILDPILCLVALILIYTTAVIIQLEMLEMSSL